MNRMSRLNAIHTSHTYSHQYDPIADISHSTPNSSGRPMTAQSSRLFSASIRYSRRVILLKPKRASMMNVRYRLNGASSSDESSSTATMVATPCASGELNQPCAGREGVGRDLGGGAGEAGEQTAVAGVRPAQEDHGVGAVARDADAGPLLAGLALGVDVLLDAADLL